MKCPACGTKVDVGARFCQQCGTALDRDGSSAIPPPVPPHKDAPRSTRPITPKTSSKRQAKADTPPPLRKKGCGFGSVLIALLLILGGGAAWFFTQQFRLERAAFERIKHSNSVTEIEQYLTTRMYMPEEHRRAAQARIAHLQSDSVDFVNATTIEACEHYLTVHPNGKYTAAVEQRLSRLRRTQPRTSSPATRSEEMSGTDIGGASSDTIAPPTTSDTPPTQTSTPARYHVVAGSFANYDTATLRAAELRGKGFSAYVMEAMTDAGRVYRVIVASYSDVRAATQTANAVRNECPGAWVMTK